MQIFEKGRKENTISAARSREFKKDLPLFLLSLNMRGEGETEAQNCTVHALAILPERLVGKSYLKVSQE